VAQRTAGSFRRVRVTIAATALAAFAATVVEMSPASADTTGTAAPAASEVVGHRTTQVGVGDTSDSYVSYRHPRFRPGQQRRLVAADNRHDRKVVYVKFHVGRLPVGAVVQHAAIDFTRAGERGSSALRLFEVHSTRWTQRSLDAHNRPHGIHELASLRVRHAARVSFPVSTSLQSGRTYSFAVTSERHRAVTRFKSRESGTGPQLELDLDVPVTAPAPVADPAPPTSDPTPPPSTPAPTDPPVTPPSTGSCSLSPALVPSCGVLFGGYLTSFGGTSVDSAFHDFNADSGSTLSLAHDYRRPGQTLSAGDATIAKTPGAVLLLNWKPANVWHDAAGGNESVNAQIDAMATSIKALGGTKIFLTIFHEPENDVSGGATGCPSTIYKGGAGTPADYRAMWANVESRFAALNVTNVVWTMNYMGFSGWNCMVDDLWPGNDLVDWVLWDPYALNNGTFSSSVAPFYNELTSLSDASHDYLSKPWGLGEFGDGAASEVSQLTYYADVATALTTNQFPRLKLLSFFDAVGPVADYRIGYDEAGVWDPSEVAALQLLAAAPAVQEGRLSVADV
jgi:hypothetical protein